MSDEQKQPVANENIRLAVAEKLASVGKDSVRAAVVEKLVADEISSRTAAVLDGMNRLSKLKSDFRKLNADQKSYDEEGKVVAQTFSAARTDERKKLNEKIEKLEKALQAALEKEDYSKLKDKSEGGSETKAE